VRPVVTETTALGAAYAAGLATGFWSGQAELRAHWQADRAFQPDMQPEDRQRLLAGWARAVERAIGWAVAEP
jgi:glycerol kinase